MQLFGKKKCLKNKIDKTLTPKRRSTVNTKFFTLFSCISLILFSIGRFTQAQAPKTPKIVFESWCDGNGEIYIMNTDGSKQKNLTRNNARDGAPVWSPQGDRLLYDKDKNLFTINVKNGSKDLLARDGFDGDWFDPVTLSVQPSAELLTTTWGQLKQK